MRVLVYLRAQPPPIRDEAAVVPEKVRAKAMPRAESQPNLARKVLPNQEERAAETEEAAAVVPKEGPPPMLVAARLVTQQIIREV